ncbi:hypothetical protein HZB60_11475 [candidate division KSB1 bacterium]|nr:hypothetical protein [candidate division KSB1 bacterium]
MKSFILLLLCAIIALLCVAPQSASAQCEATVLVSANQESGPPRFSVSVATKDLHCMTGGMINVSVQPPEAATFYYAIDSFFDVFTEYAVMDGEGVINYPPGVPFEVITTVNFFDPVYPPQVIVELVWIDPLDGVFKYFRPGGTPPDDVPPVMTPGQSVCFLVIHKVYRIPLVVPPGAGMPIISVSPGCTPADPCFDPYVCNPGGPYDYRADVIWFNGQWMLEFEYSNPMFEPSCYCVSYTGNLPLNYDTTPLLALDEREQTVAISMNMGLAMDACGTYELFSYPAGAAIGGGGGGGALPFHVSPMNPRIAQIMVAPGMMLPGTMFTLAAHLDYSVDCADAETEWIVERVRVNSYGTLERVDVGGECDAAIVSVPREMDFMQAECFVVCHDVYYVQLNTPVNGTPSVSVAPGCYPPCVPPFPCTPGDLMNCVYWTERIGAHWYLRFEYSNPAIEPVCYCVTYNGLVMVPVEPYALSVFDETTQSVHVSLWGSSPTIPLNGTLDIREQPLCDDPWWNVESFFDIYMAPRHWEYPYPATCYLPGEAFQLVSTITFNDPIIPPVTYNEWVIVDGMGMIHPFDDPDQPCTGDFVPPMMNVGEAACFVVCHDIYEVTMNAPAGAGQPIITVVPGCEPPCVPPVACIPGGPADYMYWFTEAGGVWTLHFEYSNQFIEPVCYCVTFVGYQTTVETHELAALDEKRQTFDLSVTAWDLGGPVAPVDGFVTVRTAPPGGWVGGYVESFFDVWYDWHTVRPPVARGSFTPGESFQLIAEFHYTDPPLPSRILSEDVMVTPTGGLQLVDAGGECAAGGLESIPAVLRFGQPECVIACHDIYHIPIEFPEPGIPTVSVQPGCGPVTSCNDPLCNPGDSWSYRADVLIVGGSWILEFEHSNPLNEPACYCLTVGYSSGIDVEPWLLIALDPTHQSLDATLRLSNPAYVVSGVLNVHADPDMTLMVPFDNLSTEPRHFEIPASPGTLPPFANFEMSAEATFDHPDIRPVRAVEMAQAVTGGVDPWWNPAPCSGDMVPPMMMLGQSACFVVCHRIYQIALDAPPSVRPVISVVPGCDLPICPPPIPCTPGGPEDFTYHTYFDGAQWWLEFEYSNPFIEPVCYCVSYHGVMPLCEPHVLAALDEMYQHLDASVAVSSPSGDLCNASGFITVFSSPAGAFIGPYVSEFSGVNEQWHHIEVLVASGDFMPGETFDLIVHYDFVNPPLPDQWYVEPVVVVGEFPNMYLENVDTGGECTYTNLPPYGMDPGMSWCFEVCHDVYHIPLNNAPAIPQFIITPGCYGPAVDNCEPHACTPGGPWDYRWDVHYEPPFHMMVLEFEYSNQNIEPVCYCVTFVQPPCSAVTNLTALHRYDDLSLQREIHLYWRAPQAGAYRIFSTVLPNHTTVPPSPEWVEEAAMLVGAPGDVEWETVWTGELYKNYVVICDCSIMP